MNIYIESTPYVLMLLSVIMGMHPRLREQVYRML